MTVGKWWAVTRRVNWWRFKEALRTRYHEWMIRTPDAVLGAPETCHHIRDVLWRGWPLRIRLEFYVLIGESDGDIRGVMVTVTW